MLGLFKTPEEKTLKALDREFAELARYFEEKIEFMIGKERLSSDVSGAFLTDIPYDIWRSLAAQSFLDLKDRNPEKFASVMMEEFNMSAQDLDETDVLRIDLDLDDEQPHPVDYFTGFDGLKGYQSLISQCMKYGMELQFVFAPQGDQNARLGIMIWSMDNRPLMSCLQRPVAYTPADP